LGAARADPEALGGEKVLVAGRVEWKLSVISVFSEDVSENVSRADPEGLGGEDGILAGLAGGAECKIPGISLWSRDVPTDTPEALYEKDLA